MGHGPRCVPDSETVTGTTEAGYRTVELSSPTGGRMNSLTRIWLLTVRLFGLSRDPSRTRGSASLEKVLLANVLIVIKH
jgi:hypothetical protein